MSLEYVCMRVLCLLLTIYKNVLASLCIMSGFLCNPTGLILRCNDSSQRWFYLHKHTYTFGHNQSQTPRSRSVFSDTLIDEWWASRTRVKSGGSVDLMAFTRECAQPCFVCGPACSRAVAAWWMCVYVLCVGGTREEAARRRSQNTQRWRSRESVRIYKRFDSNAHQLLCSLPVWCETVRCAMRWCSLGSSELVVYIYI